MTYKITLKKRLLPCLAASSFSFSTYGTQTQMQLDYIKIPTQENGTCVNLYELAKALDLHDNHFPSATCLKLKASNTSSTTIIKPFNKEKINHLRHKLNRKIGGYPGTFVSGKNYSNFNEKKKQDALRIELLEIKNGKKSIVLLLTANGTDSNQFAASLGISPLLMPNNCFLALKKRGKKIAIIDPSREENIKKKTTKIEKIILRKGNKQNHRIIKRKRGD